MRCVMRYFFAKPPVSINRFGTIVSFITLDDFQANRSPDGRYRTTPLNGLWTHTQGGFYHDGRFATLLDVVNHYDACKSLGLTAEEKNDLVEYLKSLPDRDHADDRK